MRMQYKQYNIQQEGASNP